MPLNYVRALTATQRSARANLHLGVALAFVAGAANAGGFLAVGQFTSHMTGIVSMMAEHAAVGATGLVLGGAGALLSFVAGAACSAMMVNFARRRRMRSQFALPLLFEAVLLLAFGVLGARLASVEAFFVPLTVMLLCFMMGLQNAVITKLSRAEIRTTHVTGLMTDIGIELGRMMYWRDLGANRRLGVLVLLAGGFFAGGVAGALGFHHLGYLSTVPLALLLVGLAIVPALDDLRSR
ncbi:YoaK family protein [Pseudoduganella sp. GCM10020061]|uniref:YoaK family protein n=1 Tax=Pseudoduganella sp. GCM10020061 TaxID=3317345 RepID=UPI0036337B17